MPRNKRCCVPNCPNVKSYCSSQNPELNPPQRRPCTYRMFQFPFKSYPQRARKWAVAIGKPEMEINSSTFICSDHFRKVDFSFGTRCLGSWAIPSLFLTNPAPVTSAISLQNEELKATPVTVGQGKGVKVSLSQSNQASSKCIKLVKKRSVMQVDKPLDNLKNQCQSHIKTHKPQAKRRKFRSPVWEYFIPDPDRSSAKCMMCVVDYKIKTTNCCTSSMVRHLQTVHGIILKPVSGINYKNQLVSTSERVEKLAPCDGISFAKSSSSSVLEKGQPCLICSSDTYQNGKFRSPLRFNGDSSSKLLDDQLWSTFILRDVLKLPREDYQNLLERVGGSVHPSNWFVVCRICERTLQQILHANESLRKLERKLERLSGTLKNNLKESLEKEPWELNNEKQEDKTIFNVRQEIRKLLRMITPLLPKEEPMEEENIINDFDETWLPSPPPPEELKPVKQEYPLPSPSPSTCLKSPQNNIKVPVRSSLKRRQLIRRSNLTKPKRARLPPSAPTPRPRRIRIRKKRVATPVMCELCGHNSSSQYDLEKHMVSHKIYDNSIDLTISTTHFICNLCPPSALFPSRKLLGAHKREKHADELNLHIYKCSECSETFLWKTFFTEHLLRKHPLKFTEQDDYDKQKVFKCEKCNYQTIFTRELRRHAETHESGLVICQYCSSSLKNASSLRRHMKIQHSQSQELQVPRKTSYLLVGGVLPRRSEGAVNKRFPCKNCDAIFPTKLELKLHLESIHKDLFTYQCDMCNKSYLSAPSLQTHKIIKHLESGKKAKCGWCGKIVNHKTYLWTHMKCCPKKPKAKDGTRPTINAIEVT